MMPVRQPGLVHHPPQLAVWMRRDAQRRPDIPGYPMQVRDAFALDDDDHPRMLEMATLYTFKEIDPVPSIVWYAFPYSRSARAQLRWHRACIMVTPHGR